MLKYYSLTFVWLKKWVKYANLFCSHYEAVNVFKNAISASDKINLKNNPDYFKMSKCFAYLAVIYVSMQNLPMAVDPVEYFQRAMQELLFLKFYTDEIYEFIKKIYTSWNKYYPSMLYG